MDDKTKTQTVERLDASPGSANRTITDVERDMKWTTELANESYRKGDKDEGDNWTKRYIELRNELTILEQTCQSCGKRKGDPGLTGPLNVRVFDGRRLCSDCQDALCYAWET